MSELAGDEDDSSTTERSPKSERPAEGESSPEPHSEDRPRKKAGANDTLLSAPAPGEAEQDARDPRVDEHERRLDQLEARLRVLEMRGSPAGPARAYLPWLAFLVALVVGWQILRLALAP